MHSRAGHTLLPERSKSGIALFESPSTFLVKEVLFFTTKRPVESETYGLLFSLYQSGPAFTQVNGNISFVFRAWIRLLKCKRLYSP